MWITTKTHECKHSFPSAQNYFESSQSTEITRPGQTRVYRLGDLLDDLLDDLLEEWDTFAEDACETRQ